MSSGMTGVNIDHVHLFIKYPLGRAWLEAPVVVIDEEKGETYKNGYISLSAKLFTARGQK